MSQIYDYTGLLVMTLSSVKPSQLVKLQRLWKTNTKSKAVLKDVKYMIIVKVHVCFMAQSDLPSKPLGKKAIHHTLKNISKGNSGYHMSYFTLLLYKVTISGNAIR